VTPSDFAIHRDRYRNLAGWTPEEWRSLDIFRYVAVNWRRYASLVIKRIGARNLPPDIHDWLPGIFIEHAHGPLSVVHGRHPDAEGERRNQIMLGTLKAIAATRIVEAVIEEFPLYLPLDSLTGVEEPASGWNDDAVTPPPPSVPAGEWNESDLVHPAYLWDPEDLVSSGSEPPDDDTAYPMNVVRLEWLRSHLTPTQYRILHLMLVEHLDFQDIADATGVGISNVRIMMLQARQRMLALMPPELASECQDLRKRRRVAAH
jgi:hypothetical protein